MILDYIMHLYLKYTHKRLDYQKYLQSKHWKKLRAKTLKRSGYHCMICNSRENLQIHHNNYSSLYWEHKSQVVCLCYRCHKSVHSYIWNKSKREAS